MGRVAFNVHNLFTRWQWGPFPLMMLAVLVAVEALVHARRLGARHAGRHWPVFRTVSFLGGLLAMDIAVQSPVRDVHRVLLPSTRHPTPAAHGRGAALAGARGPFDPVAPDIEPADQAALASRVAVQAVRGDQSSGVGMVSLLRDHVRVLPEPAHQRRHASHGTHGRLESRVLLRRDLVLVADGRHRPDRALEDELRRSDAEHPARRRGQRRSSGWRSSHHRDRRPRCTRSRAPDRVAASFGCRPRP